MISGDDVAVGGIKKLLDTVLPGVDLRAVNPEQESIPPLADLNLIILGLGGQWARVSPELATLSKEDKPPCIAVDYAASINRSVDIMRQGAADYLDGKELDDQQLIDALVRINTGEGSLSDAHNESRGLTEDSALHDRTEILATIDELNDVDAVAEKRGLLGHITQVFNQIKDTFEPAKAREFEDEATVQLSGEALRKLQEQARQQKTLHWMMYLKLNQPQRGQNSAWISKSFPMLRRRSSSDRTRRDHRMSVIIPARGSLISANVPVRMKVRNRRFPLPGSGNLTLPVAKPGHLPQKTLSRGMHFWATIASCHSSVSAAWPRYSRHSA